MRKNLSRKAAFRILNGWDVEKIKDYLALSGHYVEYSAPRHIWVMLAVKEMTNARCETCGEVWANCDSGHGQRPCGWSEKEEKREIQEPPNKGSIPRERIREAVRKVNNRHKQGELKA